MSIIWRSVLLGPPNSCSYTYPGESERLLGADPATGREVRLLQGPYGWYIELAAAPEEPTDMPSGDERKKGGQKPKRASLGKSTQAPGISLAEALDLLQWPKVVLTSHTVSDLVCSELLLRVPVRRVLATAGCRLQVEHAITVPFASGPTGFKQQGLIRLTALHVQELGTHPEDGQMVTAAAGAYGPYVSHNSVNASLPKVHCSK